MQPTDGMKQEVWQEGNHYHKAREGRDVFRQGLGRVWKIQGVWEDLGRVWAASGGDLGGLTRGALGGPF